MALILKYRLDPPDALTQEVYTALAHQVGKVGLNINIPLDEDDPEKAVVILRGEFIAVEGEHFQPLPDNVGGTPIGGRIGRIEPGPGEPCMGTQADD